MTLYDYLLIGLIAAFVWRIRVERRKDREQIARLKARLYRGSGI